MSAHASNLIKLGHIWVSDADPISTLAYTASVISSLLYINFMGMHMKIFRLMEMDPLYNFSKKCHMHIIQ